MQVYSSLDDPKLDGDWSNRRPAWVTIGSFDGVHKGHQSIVRRLAQSAHTPGEENGPAFVLTFHPHPAVVLRGRVDRLYLSSVEERRVWLAELGVDGLVEQPFTRQLAEQSAQEFCERLVQRLGMRHLLVGHDFALGRNREGDFATLQRLGEQMGFQVHRTRPLRIGGEVVSSSRIRQALALGDVQTARKLLGRPYAVEGPIVSGDGRGRTIGIPTANIVLPEQRVLPAVGVYACLACMDGEADVKAVANLGLRPTFTQGAVDLRLEAHLLDVRADLYGKTMRLAFMARLRDEIRFESKEALLAQIAADIQKARRLLIGRRPG
jgi:riboflavin kinase/FMN adenylyltransferase